MPGKKRNNDLRRVNIGIPQWALILLDRYSLKVGLAQSPACSQLVQRELEKLRDNGELEVPRDEYSIFLDVIAGAEDISAVDLARVSSLTGKTEEELIAIATKQTVVT